MPHPKKLSGFCLGYVVGLLEGEGCISFNHGVRKGKSAREYYTVQIIIGNTNKQLLEAIKKITGIGNIRKKEKHENTKYKQCYVWRICKQKEVLWFLEQCYPCLIEKKEKATLLVKFLKSRIACNPHEKANRNRKYSKYEHSFWEKYKKLKSYIPTKERNK